MGSGVVYVRLSVTDNTILYFILHGGKGYRTDLQGAKAGVFGGVAARSREPQGFDGVGNQCHVRGSPDI